jgi:two-component system probable response regulator PhcQ
MISVDMKKYAILYVDDEEQSLKYFPLLCKEFRCLTAKSVAEAREIIATHGDTIGVVITDQRMPGESGVDLLTWLSVSKPHVVRILTTAFTDIDSAISSVNSGEIYRYVVKPWNPRELVGILMHALDYHVAKRERDNLLKEKLSTLQRLVMMDRVRSFAVLAAGLSPRLQNTLPALKAYLDQTPEQVMSVDASTSFLATDPYAHVQHESRQLVPLAESISRHTFSQSQGFHKQRLFDVLAPALAVAREHGSAATNIRLSAELSMVTSDGDLLAKLFVHLVTLALLPDPQLASMKIISEAADSIEGRPAITITVRSGGQEWTSAQHASLYSALGVNPGTALRDGRLLSALFLAHHHGGFLSVHAQAPRGPGFSVTLPLDPLGLPAQTVASEWLDEVLTFQREC